MTHHIFIPTVLQEYFYVRNNILIILPFYSFHADNTVAYDLHLTMHFDLS